MVKKVQVVATSSQEMVQKVQEVATNGHEMVPKVQEVARAAKKWFKKRDRK